MKETVHQQGEGPQARGADEPQGGTVDIPLHQQHRADSMKRMKSKGKKGLRLTTELKGEAGGENKIKVFMITARRY